MSRLTQIIQNSFIRILGFISVFFKSIANLFQKIFSFFGLSQPDYYLDADNAQTAKRTEATKQLIETNQPAIEKRTATSNRRKSNDKQMDYYLKMASEIQKNQK